ncbi:hypothetical protein ABPG74_017424 [Tetrahymena malaccensis]
MKKEIKQEKVFKNFQEFYPFYLSEHSNITNRRLHYIGTTLSILLQLIIIFLGHYQFIPFVFLSGYIFPWIGHFFFEKNKPASFKYPVLSLMGDIKMWYQMSTNQIKW